MATLLKANELAERLNCSRATIYRLIARGELPRPIYLAKNCPRWSPHEIDAWIEARRKSGADAAA